MKKSTVFLSLIAATILWAGLSFSGITSSMQVNVPFEFYLEDQLLPAGAYHFEMGSGRGATASSVTVRSIDGDGIRMLCTLPEVDGNAGMNHLRFNQYGNKNFLSSISINGHKATLKTFKLEKELRSQLKQESHGDIVAQN